MKTFLLFLSLLAYTGSKANIVTLTITNINQPSQSLILSGCDTLEIINTSGLTDYFATDTLPNGTADPATEVYPDAMNGAWGYDTSYFYNLNTYTSLYVHHQFTIIFYYLSITPCVTAIHEPGANTIFWNIFPNPAAETMSIETSEEINSVELFSVAGVLIRVIPGAGRMISLAELPAGIYFVRVTDKLGRQSTQKLIRN